MDAFRKQFDLAIKFIEVCLFEKVSRETINILECNSVSFSIFLKFHTLEQLNFQLNLLQRYIYIWLELEHIQ